MFSIQLRWYLTVAYGTVLGTTVKALDRNQPLFSSTKLLKFHAAAADKLAVLAI